MAESAVLPSNLASDYSNFSAADREALVSRVHEMILSGADRAQILSTVTKDGWTEEFAGWLYTKVKYYGAIEILPPLSVPSPPRKSWLQRLFGGSSGSKSAKETTQAANARSFVNASLKGFAQSLNEKDRADFVAWSQLPPPWSAAHDDLFVLAAAHAAWESKARELKPIRNLLGGPPSEPLPHPLSDDVRRVIKGMFGG